MIRWNYLLPRLVIVLILGIVIRISANTLTKQSFARSIQALTHSKVELEESEVLFNPPTLTIRQLNIADPRKGKQFQNLFSVEEMKLEIDAGALLRRKFVVDQANIKGVLVNSKRTESGHFLNESKKQIDETKRGLNYSADIKELREKIESLAIEKTQNLTLTSELDDIRNRWTRDFDAINSEIDELRKTAETIRIAGEKTGNPLRHIEQIQDTLQTLQTKQQSLVRIHQTIHELPLKIKADQHRLEIAKNNDLAEIRSQIPFQPFSANRINKELFSQTAFHLLEDAKEYMDQGEAIAKLTIVPPKQQRDRGQNFEINPKLPSEPSIRTCQISGKLRRRGKFHNFEATLENIAGDQNYMTAPCRIQMSTRGEDLLQIEYAFQRKGEHCASQITMHWPSGNSHELNFGNNPDNDLSWSTGSQELWLQLRKTHRLDGETSYSGRLINVQRNTHLNLRSHTDEDRNLSPLVRSLENQLSNVHEVHLDATFTYADHQYNLDVKSNLGQLLTDSTTQSLAEESDRVRRIAQVKIENTFAKEAKSLRLWFAEKQQQVASNYEVTSGALDRIKSKLTFSSNQTDTYLSRLKGEAESSLR